MQRHKNVELTADSAATSNFGHSILSEPKKYFKTNSSVQVADNRKVPIIGKAIEPVMFVVPSSGHNRKNTMDLEFSDVPSMGTTNLLCVSQSVKMSSSSSIGNCFLFDSSGCTLYRDTNRAAIEAELPAFDGKQMAIGDLTPRGLYMMRLDTSDRALTASAPEPETALTASQPPRSHSSKRPIPIHERLCHRNKKDCTTVVDKLITGKSANIEVPSCFCDACALGKAKRKPLPKRKHPSEYPLRETGELIH